ncbi:DNA polymerase III epsilon subunit [hydrothermal vent metagenome]|uniref:DNA polymerase III subunit epsilon n=1 Tax=hydrothermal vent metagenome TaxID=652676 RepID=A0A3B0SXX0_9ZZZZ
MREIIFDTETTGFDPQNGDRMVEIGCLEMVGRIETGNTFHCYFNPQRSMPKSAEDVHGLSDAFLSDKKLFADGALELLEFLGDAKLVAHNAQFDFNFLNAELILCGHPPISQFRMIDTLAIAKSKHPGAKLSLDALCTRYGIDRSHRVKHGALLDAELLSQLYIELTGGRQIGLGLAEDKARNEGTPEKPKLQGSAKRREFIPPREHQASAEELERHAAFVGEIEHALWAKT